ASRRRALEQVVLEEPQQRVAEEPLFPVERRDFACELEQVLELRARSPTQCRHGDLDERQLQLRPQGVELAEQRAHASGPPRAELTLDERELATAALRVGGVREREHEQEAAVARVRRVIDLLGQRGPQRLADLGGL